IDGPRAYCVLPRWYGAFAAGLRPREPYVETSRRRSRRETPSEIGSTRLLTPYSCERKVACALLPLLPACFVPFAPPQVPGINRKSPHHREIACAVPRGLLRIPHIAGKRAGPGRLRVLDFCAFQIVPGEP